MKKKCLKSLALLTMAVASCTENIVPTEVVKSETKCENRSIAEVIKIAQNAPSLFGNNDETRGSANLKKGIDLTSITSITNKGMTRTSGAIDTLMYAINYENDEGYVIISTKAGTPGVIAYIEDGKYDMNEIEDQRTDIGYVTNLASAYIASQRAIVNPFPIYRSDTLTQTVGPYLETTWGRTNPEGLYCPNGDAGVANVAMAQVMAFYEHPDTIELTYLDADIPFQVLDWGDIKQHTIRHTVPGISAVLMCNANEESHNAIGRLCRQIGDLTLSDYWIEDQGTSTDETGLWNAARSLGFTAEQWTGYNDTCLIEPLSAGHPVVVSGIRTGNYKSMWVVDGYKELTITTFDASEIGAPYSFTTERQIYNHVNWGWDGRSNGYFLSNVFNVGNSYQLDSNLFGPVNTSHVYDSALRYLEFYK